MSNIKFDQDSGLVYNETVLSHPRKPHDLWFTRCRGQVPKYRAPHSGARSLESLAMLSVLQHLELMDASTLATLPSLMVRRIWNGIKRNELDSVRRWQVFAPLCRDALPLADRCRLVRVKTGYRSAGGKTESAPRGALSRYLHRVGSASFAWITTLSLVEINVHALDLMDIAQLENLACLAVTACRRGPATLDDRTIRAWGRRAVEQGAFARLNAVLLGNQTEVSGESLAYLARFPALEAVCFYQCGVNAELDGKEQIERWTRRKSALCPLIRTDVEYNYAIDSSLPDRDCKANHRHDWSEVVTGWMTRDDAVIKPPVDTTPRLILEIKLDDYAHYTAECHRFTVPELLWLERARDNVADATPIQPVDHLHGLGQPAAKKRKMRGDKHQALENMLQGFS